MQQEKATDPARELILINKKFKMIHNAFSERRNRQLIKYNLTSSQMDVLWYLKHSRGQEIHQREIEQWLGMKNPTVTGILNRLEEKGFIARKKNARDKRYRMIELTEKSRQMMSEMCEEMRQMDEKLYSCMEEKERRQLAEYLDRLLGCLSEL